MTSIIIRSFAIIFFYLNNCRRLFCRNCQKHVRIKTSKYVRITTSNKNNIIVKGDVLFFIYSDTCALQIRIMIMIISIKKQLLLT